jgi:hypothetical protein
MICSGLKNEAVATESEWYKLFNCYSEDDIGSSVS